jgi:hypothetical protein
VKRKYGIAGAAIAVLLAGGVAYQLTASAEDAAAPAPSPAKLATASPVRTGRAHASERAHQPTGHVDVARVEAALARMQETTAKISREQIIAEQQKMVEAKARFEAIQVAPPQRRVTTDEHGIRWAELTYASGEVRYEIASDDEVAQAGSAQAR